MFKKYLQFIFILLPIIFLIAIGSYFAYNSWNAYQKNKMLKAQLHNVELLQSLEHSVLNEIVCIATVGNHKSLMNKVCKQTKETTDSLMQEILKQKDDTSLYSLEKIILNIRNTVKNNGATAIDKLVKGQLDKKMNMFVQKYTDKLETYNQNDLDKKDYLSLYSDISKIAYATESEKALISYYLALKKPIPAKNLIYWDTTVNQSQIPELGNKKTSILRTDIDDMYQQKIFQNILRNIEDVRLDVMTNSFSGKYRTNITTWVSLLNKKQKVLHTAERMLLDTISHDTSRALKTSLYTLLAALAALLLGIIGLIVLLTFLKDIKTKRVLLDELLGKISQVSSDKKLEISENIESYNVAYNYIVSKYESLSEKESNITNENETNKIFLNNMAYEVRTPMNGISGYMKLLKETPLNLEQSDFLTMMENDFENLDSILNKISKDRAHPSKRLEIENVEFDMVKKVESVVETFSIKADQKDIVLGLYIDPRLIYKVKGDGTKLSQIITNLIDNALESSNAYDTIDITVDKIYDDNQKVNVKFGIKDHGLGYTEDELHQIRNMFEGMESVIPISNIDMKNLNITNKIIKRMGGKLEFESKKGEGSSFYFTLTFDKESDENNFSAYPTFEGLKVGLALPHSNINRQVDKNLEDYVKYLKADFKIYYYENLFEKKDEVEFPDVMFVYHNYARLEGELEKFLTLSSKIALITSSILRARINIENYTFSSIVYSPITMNKIVKIFAKSKIITSEKIEIKDLQKESIDKEKSFENLKALVIEDNEISQKMLTNILKKFNIEVHAVSNGKDAFNLVKEKEFNIIFMNVDMPTMDGLEMISKILYYEGINQLNHVPIIALSGNTKIYDQYLKAGMDACIDKKIDEDEIYTLIHNHCIEAPKKLAQSEEDALIAKVLSGDFLKE